MYPTISMKEFEQVSKKTIRVIDVRRREMYDNGHVTNAVNIPFDELATQYATLSSEETYYVICQQGVTSQKACAFLSQKGFDVVNVADGMSQWTGRTAQR